MYVYKYIYNTCVLADGRNYRYIYDGATITFYSSRHLSRDIIGRNKSVERLFRYATHTLSGAR